VTVGLVGLAVSTGASAQLDRTLRLVNRQRVRLRRNQAWPYSDFARKADQRARLRTEASESAACTDLLHADMPFGAGLANRWSGVR
jgi:hypothetical protein